jgi:alanyl-tRNA synthetase
VEGEWRAAVVATAGKGAVTALSAGAFIKEFTAKFNGRGGGKPEFAQGGGGDFKRFKDLAVDGIAHLKAYAEKAGS